MGGETLVLSPTEIATLHKSQLGAPVANLSGERDKIIAALDVLFTGV